MNLQKIENEALHLPKGERASLIQKLVLSFDTPTPLELREDWLIEAQNRAKELDQGSVTPIPGNEVLQKARALIK
ncbi:MAG: addiction module protein [Gammaproteobacteria bacterium]|jgi:putative addiction module component (TIGR02574 family)|nr:addiction module protein [Gammaproteobacteria bacterium]MBT4075936.1 addiction module protein [Gammaproteobacteria bacterium]MBT4194910.1 addiction module protein [Gammaproteobacteria bacterium]MBT4451517.1 addiction module protein [Gammaproteobacteria bacterium]MBT4861339.1 addiction module protein [Gammaproteobacteria bacterium]